MNELFHKISKWTSDRIGSPSTFIFSVLVIIVWALSGPFFKFNDSWQLIINTSTTIITFLTVFLIQNTQNRDSKAIHLKLDELIRATRSARDKLIDLEEFTDDELEKLQLEFRSYNAKKESKKNNN